MKVGAERQEARREALERSGAERRESKGSGELWRFGAPSAKPTSHRSSSMTIIAVVRQYASRA